MLISAIHDVTWWFMQPHGLRQTQIETIIYVVLTKGHYLTSFNSTFKSAVRGAGVKSVQHTHLLYIHTHMLTHLDNCARHEPSGSHHSMCTCNFLGCSYTHGHNHRCSHLHTRRYLQRKHKEHVSMMHN